MIELTAEQQRALDEHIAGHAKVIDPRTQQEYFLVPAHVYDWLYSIVEKDELTRNQVSALIAQGMREEDENDPLLESYQEPKGQP